jgi:hypothetical protein
VLAAASIAGSFFGGKTTHGSLDVWGVVGMIAFALSVGSAIRKIADLSNWLAASCTLLAAEVILWTLSLMG